MIEKEVKLALVENIGLPINNNKPENLIITYPITKLNSTNGEWDKLIMFYSKLPIFRNKIYIVHHDRMFNHFNIEEPFEAHQVELAINHLFALHHEITNTYTANQQKNDMLISNGLQIVHLLLDQSKEKDNIKKKIINFNKHS